MDLNDLRSAATVLLLLAFLGITAWAWSARRKGDFDAAAQLPLVDEPPGTTPLGDKQ
jgi:cytochrome c oxidase cbb3-type subunit IV